MTDIDCMNRAYGLALKGQGTTSPNPMVGSVILKGKDIIAEGWHRHYGADHAEVMALKKAGLQARDATMYVTLEPCHHYGKTPPCVDQIIDSGIAKVIIGIKDPNPFTNGKSIAKLRRAGIEVKVGVLQKEIVTLNEAFLKHVRNNMPFVTAKSAQTLDGKIAAFNGSSQWITSEAARRYARRVRDEYDAILVGINTVLKDDPLLSGRKKTHRIKKVVLDSALRMPIKARLFSDAQPSDCWIAVTSQAPKTKIKLFTDKGINVVECPQRTGEVDMVWLFKHLAQNGIINILIEGGAHVIGSALKVHLVDKFMIYMAPKIFGDQQALSSVIGAGVKDIDKLIQLDRVSVGLVGKDFLIQGYVNYRG